MFKAAIWRSEKNKIKAVFKLQFRATQVPQLGVDALTISLIPGDVGKPTLKLDKATVRDGSCRWENPIYETVRFLRDPKTGKINERIYSFIVSTGTTKASVLGEVSINFSDYAESTKASTVSLPLKNSNSSAVLHVFIQRIYANVDQKELEEVDDPNAKTQDTSLRTQLSNDETDENIMIDGQINRSSHNAEVNGNHRASSESDITLSGSDSSSGLDTPRELGLINVDVHQEPLSYISSLNQSLVPNRPAPYVSAAYEEHQRSQWEWSADSDNGAITDGLTNRSHNTLSRERSHQALDVEIENLKVELAVLTRQADVSDMELQTLRKQVVKESKRGQDLSREVVSLKEEREVLKAECEKYKSFQKRMEDAKVKNRLQSDGGDLWALLEEIREELNYEKDLNANLRLQLQKTQESNAELILAVTDLEEELEQKNKEIHDPHSDTGPHDVAKELRESSTKCETEEDEEQKALEELVRQHSNANETSLLEQKIMDLCGEIEIYRRDKDELEMQMEQLALDYEILKQENHDISYKLEQSQLQEQLKIQYECMSPSPLNELESQVESLEKELKTRSQEFSESLATINDLESNIKSLEDDLEKQAQGFEADLEALMQAKVEQEQRAIRAEEALRKVRSKNAVTAEKLQEEFRRLSTQMASTFEANEKVAMKAMTDANELRVQRSKLEEMLQKAKEELDAVRDEYQDKLHELSDQLNEKTRQIEQMSFEIDCNSSLIEQMSIEIDSKSKNLENQKKREEEVTGNMSQEIVQLKAEIERLRTENDSICEHAEQNKSLATEMEYMKTLVNETELLIQRGNAERNELQSTIAVLRKEAEKLLEELNKVRHHKEEKVAEVEFLQSELEKLKAQCDELRHSLFEDEAEKEELRKQVFQLKSDLKKKDDALSSIEKKLKDGNTRASNSDGGKTTIRNNKSVPLPRVSKEVTSLKERIKLLEAQIKLKEADLENSADSFSEKEKDLQKKVEELERHVKELIQSSALQKVVKDVSVATPDDCMLEVVRRSEHLNAEEDKTSSTKSDDISFEDGHRASIPDDRDSKLDDLLVELKCMKEKNNIMECELKEMQERYSEISLKFAEVEGERQKLVMILRNLRNSKKS